MSMDFVEVERAKSLAYFKQVEEIYLASFPVSQIRSTKMITRMLEFDSPLCGETKRLLSGIFLTLCFQ